MENLFLENKVNRQYQKNKANEMVAPKRFVFKNKNCKKGENDKRDDFLDHF